MESQMISNQLNNLYETFTENLHTFDLFHEQWRKMFEVFPNQASWLSEMNDNPVGDWFRPADLQITDPKGLVNQMIDEIWTTFRFPNLDQVEQIMENIGALESRMEAIQKRDPEQEILAALTEDASLVNKNDLKSLKKSISDVKKAMVGANEISSLHENVKQLETELENQKETLAKIEDLVVGVGSKLEVLLSTGSKPAEAEKRVQPGKVEGP